MPVVLRFGRFRFVIYSRDHVPAHVHVLAPDAEAKFDIETGEALAVYGFNQKTVTRLGKIVTDNRGPDAGGMA